MVIFQSHQKFKSRLSELFPTSTTIVPRKKKK